MPKTSYRTSRFGESVIRGMTRLANECGAINLSQGYPDFDPPGVVLQAAERAARMGPHQYAVTWGAPNFRAALARKQSRFMGLEIDPDKNVVVTCGSTEAMMVAMMTSCNPGDKVIVFSPFYENYAADAILCGAEPIHVTLHPPDFVFDPDELQRAFKQKPKALVLCNPANPSGNDFRWKVLFKLSRMPGLRQNELADLLDIEPITLSRIIDRVEEAGLVERVADPADRRAWRLHVTARAQPLIVKLRALADEMTAEAFAGIDPKQIEITRQVLGRVRENASRAAPMSRASNQ